MAVYEDAELSLIFLAVLPVLIITFVLISMKGIPLFKQMQIKIDRLNLVMREILTGIRVILAFNRMDYEEKRFDRANKNLTDTAVSVNKIMAVSMPLMMIIMNLTIVAIIWFGGIRIDKGNMHVGSLMAFIQYAMQIMFSLVMVSMMLVMIPRAQASAARINEVLDTQPEIKDADAAVAAESKGGYVVFDNVSFSYPGAEKPALENISFCANPGEITAIIGGTGSGKSTLVNLIPRFYDVCGGAVFIDGTDIRLLSQESLRKKIGFVPQKAVLFTGTIADNIRYGKDTATDEEIKKAADTAQAFEFISAMDNGFDSVISQDGKNLSGGQKQRLSIARALVRKPEIYIFDDAFSALDFKTDAKLRAALKKETGQSTVLIVAQRVSTVMDADRIIVLNDGKIAGIGTHKELLNTCEVYQEIVSSQLSKEEIA